MTFRIEPCNSWEEFMEFARELGRRPNPIESPRQKDDMQWDYDASPQSGMTNGEFNS